MKKKLATAALIAAAALGLAGCSSSAGGAAGGKVNLTLWMPGDCDPATCLEAGLVKGFEKKYPNIKVKVVTQPGDNYFTQLKAASITRTGPDLATMWPG